MKHQNICWVCGQALIQDLRKSRWWIPAEPSTYSGGVPYHALTRLHFCSAKCGRIYVLEMEDRTIADRLGEGFFMMSDEFEDDPRSIDWMIEDSTEAPLESRDLIVCTDPGATQL